MIVQLADSEEAERYAAGVRRMEFDSGLAPYNLALVQTWKELTSCLSPSVIDRLMPVSGSISIMAESSDADLSAPRTPAEKRLVEQLKAGRHKPQPPQQQQPSQQPPADVEMEPVAEQIDQQQEEAGSATGIGQQAQSRDAGGAPGTSGRCFYTQLPKLLKHKGASAAELTAMNMDKSTILRKVSCPGSLAVLVGESRRKDEGHPLAPLLALVWGCIQEHSPCHPSAMAAARQSVA
jgi:A1 cistron-splicing factor AAR2